MSGQDIDVIRMVTRLATKKFKFAEVGAFKCQTSKALLTKFKQQCVEYIIVDAWKIYDGYDNSTPGETETLSWIGKDGNNAYKHALNIIEPFPAARIIRKESLEAAKDIEDRSLDFVLIDANHMYEFVKNDIIAWLPKVKEGGWLLLEAWHHPGVRRAALEILGLEVPSITEGTSKEKNDSSGCPIHNGTAGKRCTCWGNKVYPKTIAFQVKK